MKKRSNEAVRKKAVKSRTVQAFRDGLPHALAGSMLDMQVLVDGSGVFLHVSPSTQRVLGYNPEELIGKSSFDFIHPDDLERAGAAFRECVRRKLPGASEYRYRRKDGVYRWMEGIGNIIFNEKGDVLYVHVSSRDITDRRLAEERLSASEELFRLITENMLDMIVLMNEKGEYTYISPSHREIMGWDPARMLGMSGFDFVHPEDRQRILAIFQESLKNRTRGRAIYRCRHRDGTYRWLESMGNIVFNGDGGIRFIVLSSRDITQQVEKQERLSKSEEMFRLITENMSDLIVLLDRKGVFLYTSTSHMRVLGHAPEELVGEVCFDYMHPDDVEASAMAYQAMVRDRTSLRGRFRFRNSAGEYRWLECTGQAVYDDNGCFRLTVLGSRDITEIKNGREKLRKANEELRENMMELEFQRMLAEAADKSKSEFIANMSHELLTPLNSIIGFTDVLREACSRDEHRLKLEYLDYIFAGGKRLHEILVNIMELASIEFETGAVKRTLFLIDDVIGSAINMYRDEAGRRRISISRNVDLPVGFTVELDRDKTKQVLYHLIGNAVKYTPGGGSITVSARRGDNALEISVADTGIGIREGDREKLFQPFVQTEVPYNKVYPGAGIGLALSKKLVEIQGGRIEVVSEPGRGSVFTVSIPLC